MSNDDESKEDRLLLLKSKELRTKVSRFFDELDASERLREEFIRNPSGIIASNIQEAEVEPSQISSANRLLFSLLANEGFRDWISDYAEAKRDEEVAPEEFAQDFAQAAETFADPDLVRILASSAIGGGLGLIAADDAKFVKQYSWAVSDGQAAYVRQYAWT
jgi:hypothetical protein